ncbi:MAG: NAD(+)/NADH kinase [Bacilli bacterium]|nr:NAD(+)/NADH kinase [Bacilli bacterium]
MNRKIQFVKLFVNDNDHSREIASLVSEKLSRAGFEISSDHYDLAIAIGGDGSFLRMVKENDFDSNIYYVGINAGTLGFLQEVTLDNLDQFILVLQENSFMATDIGIQETKISTGEGEYFFYSLNEIVIRDLSLNTCHFDVLVEGSLLEHYVGDGMLIATSSGSTAYNLSFGGSIVFDDFHSLQLTPIAPLNSKVYRSLRNSVIIPENKLVVLLPKKGKNQLLITVDGENHSFDSVEKVETVVNKKKIRSLRFSSQFVDKVHDKFLS